MEDGVAERPAWIQDSEVTGTVRDLTEESCEGCCDILAENVVVLGPALQRSG